MERIVKILTCDRCGKETEILDRETGFSRFPYPEDWGRIPSALRENNVILCPECLKNLTEILDGFMGKKVGVVGIDLAPVSDDSKTYHNPYYAGDVWLCNTDIPEEEKPGESPKIKELRVHHSDGRTDIIHPSEPLHTCYLCKYSKVESNAAPCNTCIHNDSEEARSDNFVQEDIPKKEVVKYSCNTCLFKEITSINEPCCTCSRIDAGNIDQYVEKKEEE